MLDTWYSQFSTAVTSDGSNLKWQDDFSCPLIGLSISHTLWFLAYSDDWSLNHPFFDTQMLLINLSVGTAVCLTATKGGVLDLLDSTDFTLSILT